MRILTALAAILLATPAVAQSEADPAADVSQERLEADIEALVGFGTRHTMSDQESDTRGIGAARRWGEAQFRAASEACGGCLEIVLPERMVEGRRIPTPTRLVNVVAIKRGTERRDQVIIIQGHIDSRVSDVMDFTSDAPGANDDGSGTALTIEAARVLSQTEHPATIVFALLSGEEQGLYGGQLMADYAAEQGWEVLAVLNNDIVGNSCGSDGYCDPDHVRVFSEGPRADLTEALRAAQRRDGGENDSPSRNLSRWIARLAAAGETGGLAVRQIYRVDRMGRGGDQIPFLEAGFPAVRFSVAVEDYDHQHQDLRTADGTVYGDTADEMDFAYLYRVTQLNVRAADRLARAPMPPEPTAEAAVRTSTLLRWQPVEGADFYRIYARRTDATDWPAQPALSFNPPETDSGIALRSGLNAQPDAPIMNVNDDGISVEFPRVRGDDWIFGVSSVSPGGIEGPIASAVPGGAFEPIPAEEPVDSD